jgi:hypothetical protein
MTDSADGVVVPFARFVERRERRIRIAAAFLEEAARAECPEADRTPPDIAVKKAVPEPTNETAVPPSSDGVTDGGGKETRRGLSTTVESDTRS